MRTALDSAFQVSRDVQDLLRAICVVLCLSETRLIQSNVSAVQWSYSLMRFGDLRAPDRYSLRFGREQMSLDAATQGLGVALESATNTEQHLAGGKLRPLFGLD